jgi:hypothetical protein
MGPLIMFGLKWLLTMKKLKGALSQPYPWAHDQSKGLQGREPRGV